MNAFNKLLDVANTLLGDDGCPWDKKQTLLTLQPYLLEEVHELIEAIDSQDAQKMKEELGDVFYTAIFVAKLAEIQGLFTLSEVLDAIAEKMIRRHPHIFGKVKVEGAEDVMRNWEEIKKKEGKKNLFDGMPPTLPSLARAQKIVSKLRRKNQVEAQKPFFQNEEEWINQAWHLVEEAENLGLDAESALRRMCARREKENTGD